MATAHWGSDPECDCEMTHRSGAVRAVWISGCEVHTRHYFIPHPGVSETVHLTVTEGWVSDARIHT